jgi:hypothetical protein
MECRSLIVGIFVAIVGCGSNATVDDNAAGASAPPAGQFANDPHGSADGYKGADGASETREQFCAGTGGIVVPGTGECTGDLAKKIFRFGVCTCKPIGANGSAKTRSFDSAKGITLASGGSIGTNGDITANATADIGGSAWAAGSATFNGDAHVSQELHVGGVTGLNGKLQVDGDYFGGAPLMARDGVSVSGASHVPSSVLPPCDCAPRMPIDSIVGAFENANDDAASGLEPTTFAGGAGRDVTLSCGRYYFTEISPNGNVTFRLDGRTAIFVKGDISMNGALSFVFADGAELDLFVVGNVRLNGDAVFGNADAPARVRVYQAGTQFSANGDAKLAANVYAPSAVVTINGSNTVRGSIYANQLSQNGDIDLLYDEAVLDVKGCEASGGGCSSCRDCAGTTPACNGGRCEACKTNADCCAPLECAGGACVASVH